MKAEELYIRYGQRASQVKRELDYPCRYMLIQRYYEYMDNGDLHKCQVRGSNSKYSAQMKQTALQYYVDHGRSIVGTILALGYPSKTTLKE